MTDTARDQALAQLESIRGMVAALEVDYDRLDELRELLDDEDSGADEDDIEEFKELEAAAGDCTSWEDAEKVIHEDALSVEVRSDWHTPGDDSEPSEFRIVLCTGGPHVQIVGELSRYNEPSRAWIEYQGWGTPMTELASSPGDQDALLAYAQRFYFGE